MCLEDYISVLFLSYSISSGALESLDLLLSRSITIIPLHNTIILIITHLSTPKKIKLSQVRRKEAEQDAADRAAQSEAQEKEDSANAKRGAEEDEAAVEAEGGSEAEKVGLGRSLSLSLKLKGLFLYTGILVVSCFMQSGALDSSIVLQSYSITSLA